MESKVVYGLKRPDRINPERALVVVNEAAGNSPLLLPRAVFFRQGAGDITKARGVSCGWISSCGWRCILWRKEGRKIGLGPGGPTGAHSIHSILGRVWRTQLAPLAAVLYHNYGTVPPEFPAKERRLSLSAGRE